MLPPYAWTERIIWDILSNTIDHISEIKIINPMECLVFVGCRTKNLDLTFANALAYADALHNQTTMWVGRHVKMHCVPRTLKDTQNDLHMVREYTRGLTEGYATRGMLATGRIVKGRRILMCLPGEEVW